MADPNNIVDVEASLTSATSRSFMVAQAHDFAQAAARSAAQALSAVTAAGEVRVRAEAILADMQEAYDAIEELIANAGIEGVKGDPGESAYEVAVANGFGGTEAEWLESLKGEPGEPGRSAYEASGFEGTEQEWLASLHGEDGAPGQPGEPGTPGAAATVSVGSVTSGTTASVTNVGTPQNAILAFVIPSGMKGEPGEPGASATISLGNVSVGTTANVTMRGTPQARIVDFVLQPGPKGEPGAPGAPGPAGADGRGVPLGGVTGQVLVKTGALPGQFAWRNPPLAAGTELVAKSSSENFDTEIMSVAVTGELTATPNLTNIFTRGLFGRQKLVGALSGVTTVQVIMELNADFIGLRVGLPNLSPNPQAGIRVAVGVTNELKVGAWYAHPYLDGGFWRDVGWGESGHASEDGLSVTLPPRHAAERPSITYSDIIGLKSIPRVEVGKPKPLIVIRMQFPAGVQMTAPFAGFYSWRLDGPHGVMRVSRQNVAGVTTPLDYTETGVVDENVCIPTIQYVSPRMGHQLMLVGDSTTQGLGGDVRDYGAVQTVVGRLTTKDFPIEYFNASLHAQGPQVYSNMYDDHVSDVLPTVLFYQPYSINDVPDGGMNSTSYLNIYRSLSKIMQQVREKGRGSSVFMLEALPSNTNFRATGAGDQLRRDLNVWLQTFTGGYVIPGYANAISGPENEFGQTLIAEGMTDDGVHPNGNGYNALADVVQPYIAALLPPA